MVRTNYAKQEFFMPGQPSKNDDVRKFKDKSFKKFFEKVFPGKFSEKSVIMKTIKLAVKKWHIKI